MRKLTDHIVDGDSCNHQLTISVQDAPGQGGASHLYEITGMNTGTNSSRLDDEGRMLPVSYGSQIMFQNGPIKEFGVNGLTQEALLAIIIDRLRCFQSGPFACHDNEIALDYCKEALFTLQKRTRERIARGVEGTNKA